MSCSPSARTIVCTEVFDENSQPSEEEVRDYAARIGIDVASESHLLHLARDGLMQALPPGWKPCFDEDLRSWYYFNFRTGESRWEHPLDDVYRSLVRKGRSESISSQGDDDSKDDLRSYEEADMKKTSLAPLKLSLSPDQPQPPPQQQQRRVGAAPDVPSPSARIDIDKMLTSPSLLEAGRGRAALPQEKHPRNLHQGLTLTGGGAVFLKSRQQKSPLPLEEEEEDHGGPTRGILRDLQAEERCRRQELEEEHRKSVRFNILDGQLDIRLATSGDVSEDEEEEEDDSAPAAASAEDKEEDEDDSAPAEDKEEHHDEAAPEEGSGSGGGGVNYFRCDVQVRHFVTTASVVPKRGAEEHHEEEKLDALRALMDHEERRPQDGLTHDDIYQISPLKLRRHFPESNSDEEGEEASSPTADDEEEEDEEASAPVADTEEEVDASAPAPDTEEVEASVPAADTEEVEASAPSGEVEVSAPGADTEEAESSSPTADKREDEEEVVVTPPPADAQGDKEVFASAAADEQEVEVEAVALAAPTVPREESELPPQLPHGKGESLSLISKSEGATEELPPPASSSASSNAESRGGVTSAGEPSSSEAVTSSSSQERGQQEEAERRLRARLALSEERIQLRLEAESRERLSLFQEELSRREAALRAEAEGRHLESLTALRRELEAESGAVAERRRQLQQELREQTQALEEARRRHGAALEALQEEQADNLRTLKAQFLLQEESLRRDHGARVEELRRRLEAEREAADTHRGYEKLRCEKRLLEDKYRSLKEKYLRLYTDVKVSIEKRKRRDAVGGAAPGHRKAAPGAALLLHLDNGLQAAADGGDADATTAGSKSSSSGATTAELKGPTPQNRPRRPRRHNNSNSSSNNNNSSSNDNDPATTVAAATGAGDNNNGGGDPVENLRRQLRSLEDLEEQFPASPLTHADTYLRYPFADTGAGGGGAELEFFRHRIHLERDSVRRAKDFLRVQRDSFHARRCELRQRERGGGSSARSMLDQLYKEERELTDMEVSLHRTKSLLGEKIIRLRHLEQSLQRAGDCGGAATLSDVSSHSGSSGFSSSATATAPEAAPPAWRSVRAHYHEPTEIVHSLENLNTEIRDIWQVLHRRRKDGGLGNAGVPPPQLQPPPPLAWPSQQLQDRSLVERTRSLRDWLRQARMDSPAAPANAASKAL